jgi:hypothetical protein
MNTHPSLEQELAWARTHMTGVRRALEDLPGLEGSTSPVEVRRQVS